MSANHDSNHTLLNPPVPVPEALWGDRWRFASLAAGEFLEMFADRPIPVMQLPEALDPLKLGLASSQMIPGVVIDGGRKSMLLVRWLVDAKPIALNYVPGELDGLILRAGERDRYIVSTVQDVEVRSAGETFMQRKQAAKGLHFLLVQPDDSGMTYTGLWLLQDS